MRTLEWGSLIVVAWLAMIPAAQGQWLGDPFYDRPGYDRQGYDRQGRYQDYPRRGCCAEPRPYYVPPVVAPYRAYPPPVVTVPRNPGVTYSVPPAQFWYWCDNPSGYYPSVTTCHGPWREVAATKPR